MPQKAFCFVLAFIFSLPSAFIAPGTFANFSPSQTLSQSEFSTEALLLPGAFFKGISRWPLVVIDRFRRASLPIDSSAVTPEVPPELPAAPTETFNVVLPEVSKTPSEEPAPLIVEETPMTVLPPLQWADLQQALDAVLEKDPAMKPVFARWRYGQEPAQFPLLATELQKNAKKFGVENVALFSAQALWFATREQGAKPLTTEAGLKSLRRHIAGVFEIHSPQSVNLLLEWITLSNQHPLLAKALANLTQSRILFFQTAEFAAGWLRNERNTAIFPRAAVALWDETVEDRFVWMQAIDPRLRRQREILLKMRVLGGAPLPECRAAFNIEFADRPMLLGAMRQVESHLVHELSEELVRLGETADAEGRVVAPPRLQPLPSVNDIRALPLADQLKLRFSAFDLSTRTTHGLKNARFTTPGDIYSMTEIEFLKACPFLGPLSLREVQSNVFGKLGILWPISRRMRAQIAQLPPEEKWAVAIVGLGLPPRTERLLLQKKLETVGQVYERSARTLFNRGRHGYRSLKDVMDLFKDIGLRWPKAGDALPREHAERRRSDGERGSVPLEILARLLGWAPTPSHEKEPPARDPQAALLARSFVQAAA